MARGHAQRAGLAQRARLRKPGAGRGPRAGKAATRQPACQKSASRSPRSPTAGGRRRGRRRPPSVRTFETRPSADRVDTRSARTYPRRGACIARPLHNHGGRQGNPNGPGGDWRCAHASLPVAPGSLFFYTRVKSTGDTTVQHRWYRGERLYKVVELRVRANSVRGYRTYSRTTVNSLSGEDWKVELRSNDGTLLHEERFSVH